MPLYEYECEQCAHRFEVIQKFSDPPLERCPKCGGPVHKLQSAPAFQFKGSGWYITDYAKKAEVPAEKTAPKDGSAGEKKEGGAEKKEAASKVEKPADKPAASSEAKKASETKSS
jgi:putative FmdB family regulatory protein